jgi:alcohol dehydrogenase (cytochrome c)
VLATGSLIGLVVAASATAVLAQREAPPRVEPIENYANVTAERLKHPEAGNWLMTRGRYEGWGYSPLSKITKANVRRLAPVWIASTGQIGGHEAPPLVNNAVMFVSTPNNQVMALDAKTGTVRWRFRVPPPENSILGHATTRGVALYEDKVYFASIHAVLYALDARTGREVWKTTVADNSQGYYMTLAPLVAGGKVMVGASGGERGVRGFVAAFDPDTGKEAWRIFTIPAPGEPGSETWPEGGDQWKTGGGPVWVTGNYDQETDIAYWGTGNGGPWIGDQRPGDNLYTASTLAINVAEGKMVGHFQYTPNESWDWDEVSPPILVDFRRNGRTVKGLVDAARNGYLWFLERSSGPIKFVEGKPYVHQNVFTALDPVTGRPTIDPDRKPGTGKLAEFCPSLWGGKNWAPGAFNPESRLLYLPANNNLCMSSIGREIEYEPGAGFTGATTTLAVEPGADHIGEVQAWNVDTGQKVWTHHFKNNSQNWGPILTTAGGLVFSGGSNDRLFRAYDGATGEVLWEFPTNSGVIGPPTSFLIGDRQFIAVQSGWGVDSRSMQSRLNSLMPGKYPEVPEGGAIWVFAVPQ